MTDDIKVSGRAAPADAAEPAVSSIAGIPEAVPRNQWYWCGYPGHFVAASMCRFHLHTRIGNVIVSTVGDYHPKGHDTPAERIGCDRLYETYVFRAKDTVRPEGEPLDYSEIDSLSSNDSEESERQHYSMCEKWATATAQGMATGTGETQRGATAGNSPVAENDAPISSAALRSQGEGA